MRTTKGEPVMMRSGRRRGGCVVALGILAVAILATAFGCGNGSDSGTADYAGASAGRTPTTKGEFIRRGNAICRRALEEQEALISGAERKLGRGRPVSSKERERLLITLAPRFFERKTEELAKLPVPAGGEGEVRAIIVGYERGVREIEARPGTILRGTPFLRGRKAAGRYGLGGCD
jgi:hypothetical protein